MNNKVKDAAEKADEEVIRAALNFVALTGNTMKEVEYQVLQIAVVEWNRTHPPVGRYSE